MTVGIAAVAGVPDNPNVILAADRMVTYGSDPGIEYEDTESKLEVIVHSDDLKMAVIGAGPTTYIDEYVDTMRDIVSEYQDITTAEEAIAVARSAGQTLLQNTVRNQVLAPMGFTYSDLQTDGDGLAQIPGHLQQTIAEQISSVRSDYAKKLRFIVGVVGTDRPAIYTIEGTGSNDYSKVGYVAIGSGADSALLTFIRRPHDRHCSVNKGVMTVYEAKADAEERQGVGKEFDMLLLRENRVKTLESGDLQAVHDEIKMKEREVRQSIIDDWDGV